MTTPTDLADLIRRTVEETDADERPTHVALRARLDDRELREVWIALRAAPPKFLHAISITYADSDAALPSDAAPSHDDLFQITVRKFTVPGELRIFLAASIPKVADFLGDVDSVLIGEMATAETFTTRRSRFQLWTAEAAAPYVPLEPLPDPRSFCTDLTGTSTIPADLRPWLLRARPERAGKAFRAWTALASRRLLATVSNQVSITDGALTYHFSGPPSRAFSIPDDKATSLFYRLTAGVAWMFDGQDVEARHLLLANEWARSYRADTLADLGDRALESARGAYDAYVKSSSRETLRALAELRKAVIDESQKVSQRAQDLTASLWRDFAIATVPFILKVLPDTAKLPSTTISAGIAIAAAVFLLYSYSVQSYINYRFFKHQGDARGIWRQVLNTVLSQTEIYDFSEQPIRRAICDYYRICASVGVVYLILVCLLGAFARYELTQVPPGAAPAPSVATTPTDTRKQPDLSRPLPPAATIP